MNKSLELLEHEAISIIRDSCARAVNPVMLYSIGKDSSVLLHLFKKAFYPLNIPVPLLHIDTTWKFKEMIKFRDKIAKKYKLKLIIFTNPEIIKKNINPFDHEFYTDVAKTDALKIALNQYNFDISFAGARRDEEISRAKERIVSIRQANHTWDPRAQRPELWNLFNFNKLKTQTIRVFPLSNWTELDIWNYIRRENIQIVNLYFAKNRPVLKRNSMLIVKDDNRLKLKRGEIIKILKVRFRTLGCYPLTAATLSKAYSISDIINEIKNSKTSERLGRLIDNDSSKNMEKKKKEGYF
jgi:sulfate adenylyltransferase subunit 2